MPDFNLIYGSVYGSAHYVAKQIQSVLESAGHSIRLLEHPTLAQLTLDRGLIVVTSTTGDGELPQRLQPLLKALLQEPPSLDSLRFVLVSLGYSSYQSYCGGGRQLSQALISAGALALAPSLELDANIHLNPEDEAVPWVLKLIEENP